MKRLVWPWPVLCITMATKQERICHRHITSAGPLHISHALVVSKETTYEVEKACNPGLTERQLESLIKSRGSNYESLLDLHQRHKDYENYVLDSLKDMGITSKLLTRLDYTEEWIKSADVVFSVGGDGTFLLAASKVLDNTKPVIGFNSDPDQSEGFLCLDSQYTHCVKDVLHRLKKGSFKWRFRTRIRVSLNRGDESQEVIDDSKLRESQRTPLEGCSKKRISILTPSQLPNASPSLTLPTLALNEVFIGERMSAQVSHFKMQLPPSEQLTRVKSSGLCVSTGSGSTSWHLSMNRVCDHNVAHILRCAGLSPSPAQCRDVADKYNDSLLFDPEHMEMCYTIRDMIINRVWPSPPGLPPRGFAKTIRIWSHCRDAWLVIDGGTSFVFNDGSEVLFELHPEDALRTVLL